jgi:hypothetical protein
VCMIAHFGNQSWKSPIVMKGDAQSLIDEGGRSVVPCVIDPAHGGEIFVRIRFDLERD